MSEADQIIVKNQVFATVRDAMAADAQRQERIG